MLCPCSEQSRAHKLQSSCASDCAVMPIIHSDTFSPQILEKHNLQMKTFWHYSFLSRAETYGLDTSRHLRNLPINYFGSENSKNGFSCTVFEHKIVLKIVLTVLHCLPQPPGLGLHYVRNFCVSGDVHDISTPTVNILSPFLSPLLQGGKKLTCRHFLGLLKQDST